MVKMLIPSEVIYRFNAIPFKVQTISVWGNRKKKKKSWIPCLEGLQIDKRILKKNKVEGLTWSDHKTYLESTVLKKDCGIGIKEDI